MSIDFTVAIPTYNGEARLPEVLERLRSQVGTESIDWEVIVIDNNSTDNTANLVREYQANWSSAYPLKYYLETKQGAGFARQRAVEVAQGELIGFLDDDNIPAPEWVAQAYAFSQNYPQAGAYGSQIHGAFEVEPPESFRPLLPFLAIVERGSEPFRYEPSKKLLPPSAGLVVRQQAYLESVPSQLILNGRVQGNMLTAEDLEMLCYIQLKGWEIWYSPAMEIDHKIPKWRLQREYLIPFIRGIGLSRFVTRMLSFKPWQRPLAFPLYVVNDLRKILCHVFKYRWRIQSELVAACQMELFLSSLISPFYLWRKGYLDIQNRFTNLRYYPVRKSEKCL
ncbi:MULTISPECIES: hormogonium polysaccharide biosynthesis glycosyltransferase HpsE [unclassified Coleofasciculus]|uniref:hormogonium polysaccharide biosynthesis glycosyltransferase HpsE n=1 Tax=unclassified Coleofasciculus TaxID=2692782 RepID=UPI0018801B49|nr:MULTISPECIES: hormogonium polysaccharide biosynthesis glycosyltransferase HpsE [unclassified Coleofasciculus]MBE9126715.1 glycosyltransferase family 2 protein [Coleofasciculus sp. LEGE 07081]MBE9150075.1 glycosyltransferase family 2 protein [Coleofasciculus sp. LEGE 07092]